MTGKITVRRATPDDLDAVCILENRTFPQAEAGTRTAFVYRLKTFPERFLLAEKDGCVVGMVNGCLSSLPTIEDELFEESGHDPAGKNQMIFGLATDPDYQRQGIAALLMETLIAQAKAEGRENMVLTCKDRLIHYYEKFGYENRGVSASTHGGAVWYDMVLPLK